MNTELSIDEMEPSGVVSSVRFGKRRWSMTYSSVVSALADAVLLGMIDDVKPHMDDYRAEPNDWNLFAILPFYFEEETLRRHGWKLEAQEVSMPVWIN